MSENLDLNKKIPSKSQIETDQYLSDFLGDIKVETPEDLIKLRAHIQNSFKFREYNKETKEHADSIQWRRTASDIIQDGYMYAGKACSDLVVVFLASCKALGVEGQLVKLVALNKNSTHSIVEVKLGDTWWRLDPSMEDDSAPFEGQLSDDKVWNKDWEGGWKVWKRGRDLWDLGLHSIEDEDKVYE